MMLLQRKELFLEKTKSRKLPIAKIIIIQRRQEEIRSDINKDEEERHYEQNDERNASDSINSLNREKIFYPRKNIRFSYNK